ncbi:hypothetical protein WJX72_008932 [[Myrmecia] bisecta]|uniref:Pyridine nucleotide-disulfide oxidoreductase domain-containing protein 2 n=1 Tax=[Myrmecia] bisecta TaxID=41462 RepID=A0AAW1QFY2_9CHLO
MYSRRRVGAARSVTLPAGFSAGAVIGAKGSNIKRLQASSGARFAVDGDAGIVTITGSASKVQAGEQLLNKQLDAFRRSAISSYPHPTEAHLLMLAVPCQSSQANIRFQSAAQGPVSQATGRSEQLYTASVQLSNTQPPAGAKDLAAALSKAGKVVHPKDATSKLQQKFAAVAHDVMSTTPPFADVKIRFNFGRQFLYAPKHGCLPGGPMSLTALQNLQIGKNIKAVFSNAVEPTQAEAMRAYVVNDLGFQLAEEKSTCSLHLINKSLAKSVGVSFLRDGHKLDIRKVKSGSAKLFFLACCTSGAQPDCRFKLLGQNRFSQDTADGREVLQIASACTYRAGAAPCLTMPYMPDYEADKVRFKTKRIYQGQIEVPVAGESSHAGQSSMPRKCTVRFTVSSVQDEVGGRHTEGLKVRVFEEKDMVGGACKTEYPFSKVPGLGTSTGAYLLGVMPPELISVLGLNIPLRRRDPHYFLPTTGSKYLLFGSDTDAMRSQFQQFFSDQDWRANSAMQAKIAALRDDVGPTWMQEPLSLEATADRFVRPQLQQVFLDLCRRPVREYLERFGFRSDLLKAMYAVTDGFSGLTGSWETPGTGLNFLMHNMCRLPGSDGTWMVVEGGMGTVTRQLAMAAMDEGAAIQTGRPVERVLVEGDAAVGVVLRGGQEVRAKAVVVNADPFRCQQLVGASNFPAEFNSKLESMKRDGTTMKVNLALKGLPRFSCLPEARGQHRTTIHLLPDEHEVIDSLTQGFKDVEAGRLPEFPTIEWYIHTTVDQSLQDKEGHHNSALFVQWVPYELKGMSWEAEEERYVQHLLSICDRFAPGTSDLVADTFPLTPPKIEQHFGITRGHIHHIDNTFGFDQRFPYATPLPGLYSASAGCHPGGS